jgi:light-regulated signal transduction histidine kinase (bacteriophytochrome)
LLSDLRAYTHVSVLRHEPAPEIDAEEVLQRALADLKPSIDSSEARVTYEPLPAIHLHQFQLEQLFQNLISNAIRYRSEEPPRVHIWAERIGEDWKFSVRDNGIGIDAQYREQIFGIFKRLHTRSENPGTGKGQAICQRIVERAGGRIWVESERGRGSTFSFTVPAAASG